MKIQHVWLHNCTSFNRLDVSEWKEWSVRWGQLATQNAAHQDHLAWYHLGTDSMDGGVAQSLKATRKTIWHGLPLQMTMTWWQTMSVLTIREYGGPASHKWEKPTGNQLLEAQYCVFWQSLLLTSGDVGEMLYLERRKWKNKNNQSYTTSKVLTATEDEWRKKKEETRKH